MPGHARLLSTGVCETNFCEDPIRILLISASYPPVLGGLQTVTHQLARAFLNDGHDLRVVANRYPRSLPEREVLDGVSVERWSFLNSFGDAVKSGRPDLALASVYYNPATFARLTKLMDSFQPDVLNVHFPESRLAPILRVRRRFRFRLVVSLHGDDVERWLPQSLRHSLQPESSRPEVQPGRLEPVREFLRSADAVTACSKYLLDRAVSLEPSISGKAHVIYNAVDSSRFLGAEAYFHPRSYILAYGRHTRKKGFGLLLDAFAAIARRVPELDLILAGEGEETRELQKRCAELGLEKRVVFYGRATPAEIVRLLNGCRFVVIPSRQEPFGIVALEAILSGRPLVATRVGGLPELAAAASGSGEVPVIYWTDPDARDLERALLTALSGMERLSQPKKTSVRPISLSGFSLTHMARDYQRVLEGPAVRELVGA